MRTHRVVTAARLASALALAASAPRAAGAQPAAGALGGVVYDSLAGAPLAGARVQVVRADDLLGRRDVTADSAGAFRVDSLAPGRYLVAFDHPLLDLLHVDVAPRVVAVPPNGGAARVALGVPGVAAVRRALCGGDGADTTTGLLAGRVRDAADGEPAADATVALAWSELVFAGGGMRIAHRRVPVRTGRGGSYVVCDVPAGVEVVASAAAPGRASGEVALEVPARGFVRRDLALGDTAAEAAGGWSTAGAAARGTARLTGTVRDAAGRPVRGARASVRGAAGWAVTGADGVFALAGLPAGTRTLEVRALGFAPGQAAVDLAPGRTAAADVRLTPVATLAPVTVLGTPPEQSPRIREFLERQRHGASGRFITAADIERWQPFWATDALRGSGMRVVPGAGTGNVIRGPGRMGDCPAAVFLDGLPLDIGESVDAYLGPRQVAGIEVYPDPAFAPPQYSGPGRSGCSVVLFWTRP